MLWWSVEPAGFGNIDVQLGISNVYKLVMKDFIAEPQYYGRHFKKWLVVVWTG